MSIVFKFANENSAKNIPLLPTAISYVGGILLCWDEVLVVVHNVSFVASLVLMAFTGARLSFLLLLAFCSCLRTASSISSFSI